MTGCSLMTWFDDGTAIAQTSGLSYAIVDTGQELTYDNVNSRAAQPQVGEPFYGQDAQIDGNQPSYVSNGDGTVTDLVTGLMWTQDYYGKMNQSQAAAYAEGFELAGYSDWRLPTIKEIYSLILFSGEDIDPMANSANKPFIDTNVFDFAYGDTSAGERVIDSQWATSTLYTGDTEFAGGSQLMFGVNFADGRIKGYPVQGDFYVRLVRGSAAYGVNAFVDNGDGTITDRATGLMWSQDDSGYGMSWEEALATVQDLNDQQYLGYSDWMLPNAKELQSIVDYTRSPDATDSAAINPIFHVTSITNEDGKVDWGFYWTSTTHASSRGGQAAVYIAFGLGLGYMNGRYMDVHGAGCQRSDPKSGAAEPYGRGPQGDVVRVTNMVRVTRSIEGVASTPSMVDDVEESAEPADGSSIASSGASESPNSRVVAASDDEIDADSYVLFAPLEGEQAYLIDRQGDLVHTWALAGRPGNAVYLLEGGDLLATYTIRGKFNAGGVGGGVELLTWDGEEVWSFELANDHAHLHHDVERLPDGNVLLISWEAKSRQEALAAGLAGGQLPDSGEVWSEMILEYNPDLDSIVWEWHLWDHVLPEGWDAAEHPEKIDLDVFANPQSSDWWHFNAVDYSAELDQIVISSRAASEIWIIDHDLTMAEAAGNDGDLLYRFGNPSAYGETDEQVLIAQHDSEFIDADTILVFDNGDKRTRPTSRVVEIDLPDYTSSPGGVLPEAEIVWQYPPEEGSTASFFAEPGGTGAAWFADHISGAQRLANGNTLICSGTEGRFFEVAPNGETIWEYVNPFTGIGPGGKESNETFRCEAYSADYVGEALATVDLSDAQVGASSDPPATLNDAGGEQEAVPGPRGIEGVSPASLVAGTPNQNVTITLDDRFDPPQRVQFTRIAIADVMASTWIRTGLVIEARFDIPSGLPAGEYPLTITFPGRAGEPITFRYTVSIK